MYNHCLPSSACLCLQAVLGLRHTQTPPRRGWSAALHCLHTHAGTIFHQAIVRCTVDGWQATTGTATKLNGAPLGCDPKNSGPAAVVGTIANRQAQKKAPTGKRQLPDRPFKPVLPKRSSHGHQLQGGRQVCAANPPYADVGPSNTVGQFVMILFDGYYSLCTAWFIGPNLMVTAGHCVTDGYGTGYFLDPSDPGKQQRLRVLYKL